MQRIGQDLHDDLCQHLAGIAMYASVLRGGLPTSDPAAVASIEQIGNLLADSIARTKQIARGLYPAAWKSTGWRRLSRSWSRRRAGATPPPSTCASLRTSGSTDTDTALQVYRILQEALSNALKHSGSERIEVRLSREPPAVVAEVTDYGSGLPPLVTGDGMGLRIMRYRATTAGAELRIERLAPGTRVSCRIRAGEREP